MGVRYMQLWEEKIIERQKGEAQGKAEAIILLLKKLGSPSKELEEFIHKEKEIKILDQWLEQILESKNPEEFEKKIRENTGIS